MTEGKEDLDDIIEIRDTEIDVAAIMARIRENLAKRPRTEIDVSGIRYVPGEPLGLSPAERLEYDLRKARQLRDQVFVGDQLRPPAGSLQRLLQPLKRQIHQLIRFYVDLAGARQVVVNTHMVDALEALLEKLKASELRIQALEEQVRILAEKR